MNRTMPALALALLGACGNGDDTLWTGLSGVLIFGIVAAVIVHVLRKGG